MTRLSEDQLIAELLAPLAGEGAFGLRDDCAAVTIGPDQEMVLTQDALVAGVHFFDDDPPASIAARALRVNLSDLAAKGATPAGFLLAWALPDGLGEDWLRAFVAALDADAQTYGCPLLGGDTVRTPGPLTLSVTALGRTGRGRMVKRFGARPGDRLYVSGTIGDSALGLLAHRRVDDPRLRPLAPAARAALAERYLYPRPQTGLAQALRDCASGAMDVSDGLAGDLAKMMRVSGTSARVRLQYIPLSDPARQAIGLDPALLEVAVTGGDDYEVLAAIPESRANDFEMMSASAGVAVGCIGRVGAARSGEAALFDGTDGEPVYFARGSFSHF